VTFNRGVNARTLRFAILLPLAILLAGPARGEDPKHRALRLQFRADYAPDSPLDIRQRAVDRLGRTNLPQAADLLSRALAISWKQLEGFTKETDDARRKLTKFEEPIYRDMMRATRRSLAGGGPGWSGVPAAVRDRWGKLRTAVNKAATREASERDLLDRAVAALGHLLDTLPDATGQSSLKRFLDDLKGVKDPERRALHVEVLGLVHCPRAEDTLVYLLLTDTDPRVHVAAAAALGKLRSARGLDVLISRLQHPAWPVRAAAAEALGCLGDRAEDAIEPLIEMLEREVGRLKEDAAAALESITGRKLGPIPARWRAWLEARKRGEEDVDPTGSSESVGATFYGIRTLSRRLLFILDRSGSMRSSANPADPDPERTKLAVVKRELRQAVSALHEEAKFNVIVYNQGVERFDHKRALVPANASSRRSLERFLNQFDAIGATNIYDALEMGFQLGGLGASDRRYEVGLDTIFFLTDGNPTHGKIQEPGRILCEIRRWNALRRIRIHVIAVGSDVNEDFLKALAKQSGGQYVKR
jgi:HEAT repeat protein